MAQPNILILMPDQYRADCFGVLGHPVVQTPHLDQLMSEGVCFTQATTVSPLCMPARASFISGCYPHVTGIWNNRGKLHANDDTVFQRLQQAGYHTAHIGKSHYYEHFGTGEWRHMRAHEGYMHARGFTTVHEVTGPWATCTMESYMTDAWDFQGLTEQFREDYRQRADYRREHQGREMVRRSPLPVEMFPDSYVGAQAVSFLQEYRDDRPFCLFVGFPGPHEPWDAPGMYANMYAPAHIPRPIPPVSGACHPALAPNTVVDDAYFADICANYYGKISLIDHWVGQIMATVRARGWDDLCVLMWSDHGEMAGDHGRLHKSTFLESSVRVPLTLRWPGRVPAGQYRQALAETIDLYPTLCEVAGVEPSHRCQGYSLLPVAGNAEEDLRVAQLAEVEGPGGHAYMLRTREWKYAMHRDGTGFMLYHLTTDPHERENLIGTKAVAAEEQIMRQTLLLRVAAMPHAV